MKAENVRPGTMWEATSMNVSYFVFAVSTREDDLFLSDGVLVFDILCVYEGSRLDFHKFYFKPHDNVFSDHWCRRIG